MTDKTVGDALREAGAKVTDLGEGGVAITVSMDALKTALLGDETLDQIIAGKTCSKNLGCGKSLVKEDGSPVYVFDTREQAETYEMEWRRTGLCPSCLNRALTCLDDGLPDYTEQGVPDAEPECNGICLYGSDLGVPSSGVAYAHPDCPEHGDSA